MFVHQGTRTMHLNFDVIEIRTHTLWIMTEHFITLKRFSFNVSTTEPLIIRNFENKRNQPSLKNSLLAQWLRQAPKGHEMYCP